MSRPPETLQNKDELDEEGWREYIDALEELGLTEDDVRGKKILDVGCGGSGFLVRGLLIRDITRDAYGIDERDVAEEIPTAPADHFEKRDYNLPIPERLKECDIVVALHSMDLFPREKIGNADEDEKLKNMPRLLDNFMSAVKRGGELRTGMVLMSERHALEESRSFKITRTFCEERGFEVEFKLQSTSQYKATYGSGPLDPRVGERYDSYIVIIHKPEKKKNS